MRHWILLAFAPLLTAQTPAFEVASVKTAADPGRVPMICLVPCSPGERLTVEGNRVDIRYMSLSRLILIAYRLKTYQLSGPDWMKAQRFDILAKIPDGGSKDQVPEMLQALLADRFKLTIHREKKEQPVYALVVGKSGPKLQPAAADADAPLPNTPGGRGLYTQDGEAYVDANGNASVVGGPLGPMRAGRGADGGMKMDLLKITMPALAELLRPHEDHPVIDMTNLPGTYRFTFEVVPPAASGDGGGSGGDPPHDIFADALFQALDKAGLKLEKSRAPVATVIVDRLEKTPTEN